MFLKRLLFWIVQGGAAYGQYSFISQWIRSESSPTLGQFALKLSICYVIPSVTMLFLLLLFHRSAEKIVHNAFFVTVLFPAAATVAAFYLYAKEEGHFFIAILGLILFAVVYAVVGLLIPFIIASCFGFQINLSYSGGTKGTDSPPTPKACVPTRPGMDAFNGTSIERTDIWGDAYIEHRDERGNFVGKSVKRTNLWGDEYYEHTDEDGNIIGKTETRKDMWGDSHLEHRDKNGTVTGESEVRKDFWGDSYMEHRDKNGTVTGKSEVRKDFWGDEYKRNTTK